MAEYTSDRGQQPSQVISKDKYVKDALCDISSAYKHSKENFESYNTNLGLVYVNSLTEQDVSLLRNENRSTLTFPVISAVISQQMRNIRDSIPDISVQYFSDDGGDEDMLDAAALTDRIQAVLEDNRYDDMMTDAATKAGTGGFGVIKFSTEYVNKISFEQKIVMCSVNDPTTVLFDPEAKENTRSDANFAVELVKFDEDDFKRMFEGIDTEEIYQNHTNHDDSGIKWVEVTESGKKIFTVAAYYYKEHNKKTKYLVKKKDVVMLPIGFSSDQPTENMINVGDKDDEQFDYEIVDEKPENSDDILAERVIDDVCIKRVEMCGNKVLSPAEELNFKHIPFILLPSDVKTICGKQHIIPFCKPAIDAQRAKDISFNYLFFEMVNNATGRFLVAKESSTDEMDDAVKDPAAKKVMYYKSFHSIDGETVQLPAPTYLPPAPLPADHIGVFNQMTQEVNTILGAQYQPMQQTNLSGAALYNLADFMSASTATLMSNMISVAAEIGEIILHALPMLYEKQVSKIMTPENEKASRTIDYTETQVENFSIKVDKGSNYALQQEATVEKLLKFAQIAPSMAQWLDSQGITLILENSNLSDKSKIIESYENFVKMQQQKAANMPPPPNPEMLKAQAQTMNAQANMQRAQNDTQRTQIQSAQTEHDMHNSNVDQMMDMRQAQIEEHESNRQFAADMYKQQSENHREALRYHLAMIDKLNRGM